MNDEGVIVDEFSTRVRMARRTLPDDPERTGCHLCESNQFCPNFQRGTMRTSEHIDKIAPALLSAQSGIKAAIKTLRTPTSAVRTRTLARSSMRAENRLSRAVSW